MLENARDEIIREEIRKLLEGADKNSPMPKTESKEEKKKISQLRMAPSERDLRLALGDFLANWLYPQVRQESARLFFLPLPC